MYLLSLVFVLTHSFVPFFANFHSFLLRLHPRTKHFYGIMRLHPKTKHLGGCNLQGNSLFVLFALTLISFGTCITYPFDYIRAGDIYGVVEWSDLKRPLRTLGAVFHWSAYACFVTILPFLVHSDWRSAATAVVCHMGTCSFLFGIFSQINHLNEDSLMRNGGHADNPILKDSWAVDQVETSNNFCPNSLLWHVLSNGLNLQIEHHLFPGLNHCHLPRIQATVQATCEEFGVSYKSYNSWSDLMGATLKWFRAISVEPYPGKKEE
jgi:fatty acid desaturase